MVFEHTSVMPREALEYLALKPGGVFVDATLGGCGHAAGIVQAIGNAGVFIGIDRDIDAVNHARQELKNSACTVHLFHDSYASLPSVLSLLGIDAVDGLLVDLGLSLHQITRGKRGFSFMRDEPLDMRMDIRTGLTAADIVNTYEEERLVDIFFTFGEERFARKIAKGIIENRRSEPISSSLQLAQVISRAVPRKVARTRKIHPATQVFQALRIVVNQELGQLEKLLAFLPGVLKPGGRACVISFHSLEDRLVKQALRSFEKGCTCPRDFPQCVCGFKPQFRSVVRKPVLPSAGEIASNPMARSARLRVAERL